MLTVIQRPEAYLYENNPPQYGEDPYYISRWSSAHLPLVYRVSNTKFPVNTEDSIDAYTEVLNVGGFARFNLAGSTYEEYIVGEKVTVTGSIYAGTYEVKDVQAGEYVTLDVAFSVTSTGTIQRYYDNYAVLIKLYAGIPSSHPYTAQDPMTEIGVFAIAPNSDNISVVDVRDLVRQKINQVNDIDGTGRPNDLNAWTAFYIEYAETYDTYDGGIPESFTSDYSTDYIGGCADVDLENPNFTSNLDGWSQNGEGTTDAWIWESGNAKAIVGGSDYSIFKKTNLLYQTGLILKAGIEYTVNVIGVVNKPSYDKFSDGFTVYAGDSSDRKKYRVYSTFQITSTGTESLNASFVFTLPEDCGTIGFDFEFGSTYPDAYVEISSIEFQGTEAESTDCIAIGFAHNGTRQFFDLKTRSKSRYGGNMAEYVQNYNVQGILGKFLTRFDQPQYFFGKYFDISTIIPQSTLDIPFTEDGLLLRVKHYDEHGIRNTIDHAIVDDGDGVYRLRLDNKLVAYDYATIQILRHQTNVDWVTYLIKNNEAEIFVGNRNNYTGYALDTGFVPLAVDMYTGGAIISASNGGTCKIYRYENGTVTELYSTFLATFQYVKAFDGQNWAAVISGTNGDFVISKEGVIAAETIGVASYPYGLDGASIDELYVTSQVPFNSSKLIGRNAAGIWSIVYDSGVTTTPSSAKNSFQYIEGFVFTIFSFLGASRVSRLNLSTLAVSTTSLSVSSPSSISLLDLSNGIAATTTDVYTYDGSSWTIDNDFTTIRSSYGDSSTIVSVSYQGQGLIMVVTADRIYTKDDVNWGSAPSGDYFAASGYFQIDGSYSEEQVELEISEIKTITINTKCATNELYLSWMNTLGNWEYFLFTARKGYERFNDAVSIVTRNIYTDWPNNFATETERDRISIEAYDKVTVRSQYVTRDELDVLSELISSIRVQAWYSATEKITVMVDTDTISKYSDGDKLYAIEFDIIYPKVQIQKQ